jgi:hypothetical protein
MKRILVGILALAACAGPASAQYGGGYYDRGYGGGYGGGYYGDSYGRRDYGRDRGYDEDEDYRPRRDRRSYDRPREERRGQAGGTCVTPQNSCPTGQPVAVGTSCFCRSGSGAIRGSVR